MNPSFKRFQTPLLTAALLALTVAGFETDWTDRATAPLARYNQAFLDDSIRDTRQLLIPVTIAKATADIIEGSTLKADALITGMTIEAGDIAAPMLECLNVAWNLLLASMIYLVAAKCVLAGANAIGVPFLIVALGAFLLNGLAALAPVRVPPALRQTVQRFGALFLLCALLFLLLVPLTVTGSAYLARRTTDPMRQDIQDTFTKIGALFTMDRYHAAAGVSEKAAALKDKLAELGRYAKDTPSEVTLAVCKLAVVKLLNGIVFPLASLAFLIWLVRGCLYPALGLGAGPAHPPAPAPSPART
jgi:hypothetical protein